MTRWYAEAVQVGTGDRMWAEADTREAAVAALMGQAYGPVSGTVRVYREAAR